MNWLWEKPETWDHRDKAQARWYHGGLIGSTIMGRRGARAAADSPTTTYEQKRIANEILKLSEELERLLREERINC